MRIKNIHIILISASSLLSFVLGIWAINHSFQLLGYLSLAIGIGLVLYGIQFIKKAKAL